METSTDDVEYEDYTTYPEYKAGVLIWKVVPPILIVFGTIGNILSIIVLTRKSIKVSTTALYLTFLAFSDLCVLYTGLLRQWLIYLADYDVRHVSQAGCKVHIWFVYTSLDFSAWILIAVTLERVISAWCPYNAKSVCSRKYATALVIVILIFILALNSHLLYGMVNRAVVDKSTNATTIRKCVEIDKTYADFFNLTWPWIDLCAFCLIPFLVIVVGNCLILFRVIKSHQRTNARIVPSINTGQNRASRHNGPKHSSMTAMLFTLNIVFLITTSPVSIYNIGYTDWLSDGSHQTYATLDLWWAIVNMLMYTNNSLNFLLYCLSGTRFRQEVKRIFCSRFGQRNQAPLDIYTRTKFNTHVPTQTPSVTPNAERKIPTMLQLPGNQHLHSSDTSGFGSSNTLHPSTALIQTDRTTSVTSIPLSNGSVNGPLKEITSQSLDTEKLSPSTRPTSGTPLVGHVIGGECTDKGTVYTLPNQSDDIEYIDSDKTTEVPVNTKILESVGTPKHDDIVGSRLCDIGRELNIKEPDTTSNHSNVQTLTIPTISATVDDGLVIDEECTV